VSNNSSVDLTSERNKSTIHLDASRVPPNCLLIVLGADCPRDFWLLDQKTGEWFNLSEQQILRLA